MNTSPTVAEQGIVMRTGAWPDLLVHSQPLPLRLVHSVLAGTLTGAETAEIDALLATALDTLERAGCDGALAEVGGRFYSKTTSRLARVRRQVVEDVQSKKVLGFRKTASIRQPSSVHASCRLPARRQT